MKTAFLPNEPIWTGLIGLGAPPDPRVGFWNRSWLEAEADFNFKASMPFPLAHPAAVLPLRRFCPRYLSFPALVVGSLCPDLGYLSGDWRLGNFSHRFLAGGFGFCLPVGLVVLAGLHFTRLLGRRILGARGQPDHQPERLGPVRSAVAIVVSLLLGAWSHLLLDALTHPDYWLLRYLPWLQGTAWSMGGHRFLFCDVLYAACTFGGVAWLAVAYLQGRERGAHSLSVISPAVKWGCSLWLAGAILVIAESFRGTHQSLGLVAGGISTILAVTVFLWGTEKWLRRSRP